MVIMKSELQYCMGENENVLKGPRCRGLFVFCILQYFLDERNVKNVHISEKGLWRAGMVVSVLYP